MSAPSRNPTEPHPVTQGPRAQDPVTPVPGAQDPRAQGPATQDPPPTALFDRRTRDAAAERPFRGSGRTAGRPNIVFILADDLGWGDLGCFGSLHNRTPSLDALASQGLRFTHGYATSATCSPTRLGLYTGRYPGRLTAGLEEPLGTRDEHHGIPADHPTLPSLLVDVGYRTAMIGKWHCGWLPWFSPLKAGFQTFYGNLDGAVDYFGHFDTSGQPDLWDGEEPVTEQGYYTEIIGRHAAAYIREAGDDPFYLQVNFTGAHWPWEGPDDEELSRHIADEPADTHEESLRRLFHADGGSLAKYGEMVAALDASIGEVLAALDAKGMRDNTIVVFASDNGGERWAFMWPFVGEKGDLEEGGIRVPLIVRWPAVIDAGQVSDLPNATFDWTATLLDAAGATPDADHPLDGTSLLGWLTGTQGAPQRDLLWRTREQGAVRRGHYKLLVDRHGHSVWHNLFGTDGRPSYRLFDLSADGREKADVADQHPGLVAELKAVWRSFDEELLPYPDASAWDASADGASSRGASTSGRSTPGRSTTGGQCPGLPD
ncbi:N-acetylgalactosamine-6-sulfate sulfatase [Propionibacterium freudenreichii]|nr:N-acetylgalactosamine-6-sulfate sulfatase [Propionibacterium freudenreichii]